jgi:hypothetical protein
MRYLILGLLGGFLYTAAAVVPAAPAAPAYPLLQTATSTDASYNWAGYVAQGGRYGGVSASWTVPSVTAAAGPGADATWVGIGGVTAGDLLQVGTQAVVDPSGAVSYQAWLEMMPGASVTLPLTVAPGDRVSASLTERSAGRWEVSIADVTNGRHYDKIVAYDSSHSSAEWVEEMPSLSRGGLIPLDNFGTVHFSGATAIVGGQSETLAQTGAQPLLMVSARGEPLAQTSVLADDGSFNVTRTIAPQSVATRFRQGRRIGILILQR